MDISYSEAPEKTDADHTGTTVHIHGIPEERAGSITTMAEPEEMIPDLLTTFAPYLLAYTDITIKYNDVTVDPARQIKNKGEKRLFSSKKESSQLKPEWWLFLGNKHNLQKSIFVAVPVSYTTK